MHILLIKLKKTNILDPSACDVDDGLSINNNSKFDDFVDRIYPIELDIKDTTNVTSHHGYVPCIVFIIRPFLHF